MGAFDDSFSEGRFLFVGFHGSVRGGGKRAGGVMRGEWWMMMMVVL